MDEALQKTNADVNASMTFMTFMERFVENFEIVASERVISVTLKSAMEYHGITQTSHEASPSDVQDIISGINHYEFRATCGQLFELIEDANFVDANELFLALINRARRMNPTLTNDEFSGYLALVFPDQKMSTLDAICNLTVLARNHRQKIDLNNELAVKDSHQGFRSIKKI